MKRLFLGIIILIMITPVNGAVDELRVDVAIHDDGLTDWNVIQKFNTTVEKSDYFVFGKLSDVNVFANGLPVKCDIKEKEGTILCTGLNAQEINYKFRVQGLVKGFRNFKIFQHRFAMTEITNNFVLSVKIPIGTALVEKSDLTGTGFQRLEPTWGREGSDGRYIYVDWLSEPKLGETYDVSVIYENVQKPTSSSISIIVIGVLIAIVIIILAYMYFSGRSVEGILPVLTDDERKIVEMLLKEKTIDQRKIVKEMDFSKPKVTRILRNLMDRGIIEKRRKGRTNIITLTKKKRWKEK